MVQPKEVVWVVLALHLGEAIVVRTVGGAYAISFVVGEEIDVNAATGEGGRGIEEVARPADAAIVVGRVLPAAVDVHDKLGIAVGIGCLTFPVKCFWQVASLDKGRVILTNRATELGFQWESYDDVLDSLPNKQHPPLPKPL